MCILKIVNTYTYPLHNWRIIDQYILFSKAIFLKNPYLEQPSVSFPPVYEAVAVLFSEVSGMCSFHYHSTAG